MNSKKDNEDQDGKNSNDNNAKKKDKSNENSDDSNFFDISNNDGKGDKSDNSRFRDYSSTRSPPKGKSTSSPPSKDSNDFKQKINNEINEITKKINRYKVG